MPPESPTSILMDVDTGVDDAFALLFAVRHPALRLLGVTCVDGNVGVDQVVTNTLKVLDAAGAQDIPVARGAERPLIETPHHADLVHGADGLGDLELPPSGRAADPTHAMELLHRTLEAAGSPITVVATGPLTNIALLVRTYPRVAERIARIVLMGGSAGRGNATATAEFNVWHDPEAAAIVIGSGLPVTMYGLDVFYDVNVTVEQGTALAGSAEPGARLAGRLIGHQHQVRSAAGTAMASAVTLGDYGTLATIVDPDGVQLVSAPTLVVTAPGPNRGQTIVDLRPRPDLGEGDTALAGGRRIDVAITVDGPRYADLWLRTIEGR